MGEPAAAHAFLDGHLGITLPPETHARLTADHVQLAAVDHTREPLIETAAPRTFVHRGRDPAMTNRPRSLP